MPIPDKPCQPDHPDHSGHLDHSGYSGPPGPPGPNLTRHSHPCGSASRPAAACRKHAPSLHKSRLLWLQFYHAADFAPTQNPPPKPTRNPPKTHPISGQKPHNPPAHPPAPARPHTHRSAPATTRQPQPGQNPRSTAQRSADPSPAKRTRRSPRQGTRQGFGKGSVRIRHACGRDSVGIRQGAPTHSQPASPARTQPLQAKPAHAPACSRLPMRVLISNYRKSLEKIE